MFYLFITFTVYAADLTVEVTLADELMQCKALLSVSKSSYYHYTGKSILHAFQFYKYKPWEISPE